MEITQQDLQELSKAFFALCNEKGILFSTVQQERRWTMPKPGEVPEEEKRIDLIMDIKFITKWFADSIKEKEITPFHVEAILKESAGLVIGTFHPEVGYCYAINFERGYLSYQSLLPYMLAQRRQFVSEDTDQRAKQFIEILEDNLKKGIELSDVMMKYFDKMVN